MCVLGYLVQKLSLSMHLIVFLCLLEPLLVRNWDATDSSFARNTKREQKLRKTTENDEKEPKLRSIPLRNLQPWRRAGLSWSRKHTPCSWPGWCHSTLAPQWSPRQGSKSTETLTLGWDRRGICWPTNRQATSRRSDGVLQKSWSFNNSISFCYDLNN